MNSMCLERADEIFSETTMKHLVSAVELLDLEKGGWRNIIPEIVLPEDEGTLNLVKLSLYKFPQLECLVDNNEYIKCHIQNVLSKLVELRLSSMENFKELCSGSLPVQLLKSLETLSIIECKQLQGMLFKSMLSLCNLKSLIVESCPMLTSLCQLSTTQSLVLLEDLYISNCDELKCIVDISGYNEKKISSSVFPNLETLGIHECPKLDFILPVIVAQDVPKLKFIYITHCSELKCIFCEHQNKHEEDLHQELTDAIFVILKEVYLFDLPKFVDIKCSIDDSKKISKM
ncbi:hypothetical protein VNO78_24443 [Psophocarpus tetragonolobus]|uniref:Disease resistance protein At4g27190-like leucine-rich repeats domain-containing protein n=1 Tax=Psophocarpus tetragonolobus TaxID=3891 RepID=A0AAN9S547_PSOTE